MISCGNEHPRIICRHHPERITAFYFFEGSLNGLDREVATFLDSQAAFEHMYEDILSFLKRWIPEYVSGNRSYLTVALGCTGGQHRSVRMTEKLAAALGEMHDPVHTRHNELAVPPGKNP